MKNINNCFHYHLFLDQLIHLLKIIQMSFLTFIRLYYNVIQVCFFLMVAFSKWQYRQIGKYFKKQICSKIVFLFLNGFSNLKALLKIIHSLFLILLNKTCSPFLHNCLIFSFLNQSLRARKKVICLQANFLTPKNYSPPLRKHFQIPESS